MNAVHGVSGAKDLLLLFAKPHKHNQGDRSLRTDSSLRMR